jgi:succinate dehydrogenase / fumarate reductase, cytochrome b subunit
MNWSNFYTGVINRSGIDRKVTMASTGIFLLIFLIIHLGLNATILVGDDGELFNHTANLLHASWVLHILELLVFSGLVIHIWQGAALTRQNQSKRSISYAIRPSFSLDPARFMGWLGVIVFGFLLLHLYQFWLPQFSTNNVAADHLAQLVMSTLSQGWVVIIYLIGCLAVAAHLWHGCRSAAITLGLTDRRYQQLVWVLGTGLAIAVPLGLAAIPIAVFASTHAQL